MSGLGYDIEFFMIVSSVLTILKQSGELERKWEKFMPLLKHAVLPLLTLSLTMMSYSQNKGIGTIRGSVVDEATRHPLEFVNVVLRNAGDSSIGDSTSRPKVVTITHWSRNAKLFWSHESADWKNNSFDDAELDTSKLVVPRATIYGMIALSTSFSTYGFENEWSIALGNLTHGDDLVTLDLGIGGVYGTIPKTGVSNQVVPISYYSTSSGHPLKQGTATYTYSIHGTYVAASIPLMLEWRYGLKPISLNVRVGMLYRIASVTADRRFSANGFPQDYDVSRNEGRFTYFNNYEMTESFDHKISQLLFAAIPCIGISTRLPLTSQTDTDEGYGIIVGADFGAATRLYVAVSY